MTPFFLFVFSAFETCFVHFSMSTVHMGRLEFVDGRSVGLRLD